MRTFLVDENGDRITKNGLFVFAVDIDAVLQTCEQIMRVQLKEYQYDQTSGIEYLNNVFTDNANLQMFEAQARTQLLSVANVVAVKSLGYEQNEETLSYAAVIETIYGVDQINGTI